LRSEAHKPATNFGDGKRSAETYRLFLSTLRETIERFAQRILKALTKPGLFMEPKTPEEQMLL
jgi:hypothetical protein